jgi:molecular chaperone GrpE
MPSAEVKAEHVSSVIRTGYTLNGRLLRPASVVISSGKAGT